MRILANDSCGILTPLCGTYNPKLDYLFCKHFSASLPDILNEERWRDIFDGNSKPEIPAQRTMLAGKEILSTIAKGGEFLALSDQVYRILVGQSFSEEDRSWLLDMAQMTQSPAACDAFLVHSLQHFCERPMGVELSKALMILLLARCGHPPICLYQRPVIRIMDEMGSNLPAAVNMVKNLRLQSESMNRWHVPVSRAVIFEKLKECIPRLQEKYGVKELYVYGSYAKDEVDGYSDLDVYLRIDEMVNGKTGYSAMGFIRKSVGVPVDGHVTYASKIDPNSFRGEIRRHLIKVI